MKQLVIDTNILLRFLLNDIPAQSQEVISRFEQAKRGKIKLIIPQIVIFEIVYALIKVYGFKKDEVIDGVKKIIISDYLEVEDKEIFKTALELFAMKNLSLADCFIVAYAKENNQKVFSFDKDLNKLLT